MRSLTSLICVSLILMASMSGCARTARDLSLDKDVARDSLTTALTAWVAGQQPSDLLPKITVGDASWTAGKKLVSFELKTAEETSDGTNLYVPVVCRFESSGGKVATTETIYIVGTSPVITIFPQ
ncbi:hypothetical protein GC163_14805 [bacterium]|nr:hypothetical protein [bacterium]